MVFFRSLYLAVPPTVCIVDLARIGTILAESSAIPAPFNRLFLVINYYMPCSNYDYTLNTGDFVMAKPIRATPELKGEEAVRFIERMHRLEKAPITAIDRDILARVRSKAAYFDSFIEGLICRPSCTLTRDKSHTFFCLLGLDWPNTTFKFSGHYTLLFR